MSYSDPKWLEIAKSYNGLREYRGKESNPEIVRWIDFINKHEGIYKAWWREDNTPWCSVFVSYCLAKAGRFLPKEWYRAKEYAKASLFTKLDKPAYGCIVIFGRENGGHIGFIVGADEKYVYCLGGNQSDAVNIKRFNKKRVIGYYWPSKLVNGKCVKSRPYEERYNLTAKNAGTAGKVT